MRAALILAILVLAACAAPGQTGANQAEEVGCETLTFTVDNRVLRTKCTVLVYHDSGGGIARLETLIAGTGDELLLIVTRATAERGDLPSINLRTELNGFLQLVPGSTLSDWGDEYLIEGYAVQFARVSSGGRIDPMIVFGRNERPRGKGYGGSMSGIYALSPEVASTPDVAAALLRDIKVR